MVGRLDPVKDYENALHAWAMLARESTRVRLTIVGEGSQRLRLECLAKSLGVHETVEFVGNVDPGPYLFGARVFLQSSRAEGFSRALLEALMAGLPAVTTDVGGVREVSAGVVRIVPKEDCEALAGALRLLLADSGAADRARDEAYLVSSQFELPRCCRSYREIYRELGVA
jgi:glycosyltransferase involved in cell wall biosynthesis